MDEYFSASRARDPLTADQQLLEGMQRTLTYLVKRYPRRISVQWVSPWSLGGLWISIRFRIRTFPAVIINRRVTLVGPQIDQLADQVVAILSHSPESAKNP